MNSIASVFWNALLTATAVTLLAGFFVAAMPPVYRATAVVKGDSDAMLKIQSGDLLQSVVGTTKADLGKLEGWLEQLMNASADPVVLLKEKLTVSVGADPDWVNVSVEAQSARAASILANDLAHLYLKRNAKARLSPEEKAYLFLAVEESNINLLAFLQTNPALINIAAEEARLDREVAQFQNQRQRLSSALQQSREQHLAVTKRELGRLTEPGVVRAAQRLQALKVELAALGARYGAQHVRMLGQHAEIRAATELLDEALGAYGARLELKILEYEGQLSQADEALVDRGIELDRLVNQQLELKSLELTKEAAVKKFEGMTEDFNVALVADAVPPRNTFGFNQLMLLGFVFLGSFMLMVILMMIRSARAR